MDRQAKIESLKLGQTKEQRKEIEQLLKEVNEIANKDYFTKLLRTPSDQSFQQIGTQIKFKSTSDFNNVFNKVVMQSMTDYIGNIAKRFFADVIEPLNNSLTKKDGRKDFDINKDV